MVDGLFATRQNQTIPPERWLSAPFNNNWTCSLFVSQDPVALESVIVDFLRAEDAVSPIPSIIDDVDNYLHEAAQADSPPSGTFCWGGKEACCPSGRRS